MLKKTFILFILFCNFNLFYTQTLLQMQGNMYDRTLQLTVFADFVKVPNEESFIYTYIDKPTNKIVIKKIDNDGNIVINYSDQILLNNTYYVNGFFYEQSLAPYRLYIDSNKKVYIKTEGNLYRFNDQGQLDSTFSDEGVLPLVNSLYFLNNNNNIFIPLSLDTNNNFSFKVLNYDGSLNTTLTNNLSVSGDNKFLGCYNDKIYFLNDSKVKSFDLNLNFLNEIVVDSYNQGFKTDNNGGFYFHNIEGTDYSNITSQTVQVIKENTELAKDNITSYSNSRINLPSNFLYENNELIVSGVNSYSSNLDLDEIPEKYIGYIEIINNNSNNVYFGGPGLFFKTIKIGEYYYVKGRYFDNYFTSGDHYYYVVKLKISTPLAIKENLLNEIKIENPIPDNISLSNIDDFLRGEVYNLEGKKVLSFNTKTVNTTSLIKGNYFLKIYLKSGEIFTKKVIKK